MSRWARDGRDSPLKYTTSIQAVGARIPLGMAGIHRSSTLSRLRSLAPQLLGMAGIHRSSTLEDVIHGASRRLGMAGIHRSSTLGRAELAEKWQVGAASLFQKSKICSGASSGSRGFLP